MMSEQTIEIVEDEQHTGESRFDTLVVRGEQVWDTLKSLVSDVTVRRVTVQRRDGKKILDLPLYAGVAGVFLLGPWAALPLAGALLFEYSIVVERRGYGLKQGQKPTLAKPAPAAITPEVAVVEEEVEVEMPALPDDLTRINGVGPKVASLLQESGIQTFAQLARTDVARLQAILDKAGSRYRLIDPTDWPEQARQLSS
jgi:predicted flap endonuclease-1-like 5' DNA nuclease